MGVINTNISSLVGLNNIRLTNLGLQKTLERLSSGLRINVGADDPSGLAIAKGMEAQINGVRTAVQNAEDGISMIHTADGSLAESHDILMRMRDLTLRAANEAVMTSADQKRLSDEFKSLKEELRRKALAVTFNQKRLFWGSGRRFSTVSIKYIASWNTAQTNFRFAASTRTALVENYYGFGSTSGGMKLQIGPDNGAFYAITLVIGSMTLTGLGLTFRVQRGVSAGGSWTITNRVVGGVFSTMSDATGATITIHFGGFGNNIKMWRSGTTTTPMRLVDFTNPGMSARANASIALKWLDLVDSAINKISNARAALGIQERRLGHIIDDLKAEDINVSAAKSRIYDADMAVEISEFTRLQILQQSGTAILAQANAQPQSILQLLR